MQTVLLENIHIAGQVGDTGHTAAERPRKGGKTAAVVTRIGSAVRTRTGIAAAVVVHCALASIFGGSSRHIAHVDRLNEVVHFGIALAVCVDSSLVGIVNGMAGIELEGGCTVVHELLQMVEPIGDLGSDLVADAAFLLCGEVVLTAEPEVKLEAVARERRREEVGIDLAVFLASRPFFDQELAAGTVAPFLIDGEVVALFHPAGLQTDGVTGQAGGTELRRVSHNLVLIGGVLIEESQTVRPFGKKRGTAREICKALQKIRKRVARKDRYVNITVGQIPYDLVCVFRADVNAVPPGRVAKDTVSRLRHDEGDGHLVALIYDALEVSLAVEHESVGIRRAAAVEKLVLDSSDGKIFGILLEIHGAVATLRILADDLLGLGAHTAERFVEIRLDGFRFGIVEINRAFCAARSEGDHTVFVGHAEIARRNAVFNVRSAVLFRLEQKIVTVEKRFASRRRAANADHIVGIGDNLHSFFSKGKFLFHRFQSLPFQIRLF